MTGLNNNKEVDFFPQRHSKGLTAKQSQSPCLVIEEEKENGHGVFSSKEPITIIWQAGLGGVTNPLNLNTH